MQVLFNTDDRVEGGTAVADAVEARIRERLERFSERLTRVDVYVRDVDGHRNGPAGIEARIEVRAASEQPMVTSDSAGDVDGAIAGALRKTVDQLDSRFGRRDAVR